MFCQVCHKSNQTVMNYSGLDLFLCLPCARMHRHLGNMGEGDLKVLSDLEEEMNNFEVEGGLA